jgi:Undecaprenyl-phosphate galactose phosphotransferase WbaP
MQDSAKMTLQAVVAANPDTPLGFDMDPAMRRRLVAAALIAGDIAGVVIALGLVTLGARLTGLDMEHGAYELIPVWAAILCASQAGFGLYGSERSEPVDRLRRRVQANIATAIALVVYLTLSQQTVHWPAIVVGCGLMIIIGFYNEALIRGWLLRHALWSASTVLFGTTASCLELAKVLLWKPELGLRPIAILGNDDTPSNTSHLAGLPVISPVQANIAAQRIEVAICASGDADPDTMAWLSRLPLRRIFILHDSGLHQSLQLRTRTVGDLLGLELRSAIHIPINLQMKRFVDLAVAIPAGLLALPVIGLLAIAIKWIDGGPAFYTQLRVGRSGQMFEVYKLRSMYADADSRLEAHLDASEPARREWQRFFKLNNDPRILPLVGQFIRRSSLDELPQLWNVLRGDMSVVGPRPFPPYHTERFDTEFQALRASVPPGLTGLWQVTDRSDGDLDAQKRQDSFYIRNWSFWLDLYVLLQTVPAMISARGAR